MGTAPRRIGHVINSIGLGGVPEAAWHMLEGLAPGRWERRLFVLSQPESEADARAQRLQRWTDAGIPVTFAPAGAGHLARQGALGTWLREQRIELLHTHSYKPNLYARATAVAQGPGAPRVVAHYHNQYDNKWTADGSLALDAQLADASAALVACSASVARHVEERLARPAGSVEVVPNGVDTARFRRLERAEARSRLGLLHDADDAHRPMVGIVGRLCRQKGQDLFLRAVADLARDWPQVRWLIVGAPDQESVGAELRAQAEGLGLRPPALQWLGHCTDMPAVYSALDLLVAPSRWEGFGLMLVEAMATGTPIVGARAGAIPEVVGDGGCARLVPPEDAPALATAMSQLLADPAARAAMGAQGLRRAADFAWARSAERLDALYTRLLAAPQERR